MAVTRLKRKDRRNKARAANRNKRIKQLSRRPVIKKLDVAATATPEEVTTSQEEE